MEIQTIFQILLFGVALSMDAFAVSVTDGLIYSNINKKKSIFIATTFGIMQGLMPLLGYWLVELISKLVGETAGAQAGQIMATVVTWISFALLLLIGGKMLIEGIKELKKPIEKKESKLFSYKEVLMMGIATSIDALAVGVSLHSGLSTTSTIWLHVSIITIITFIISCIGVFLGHQLEKLFKGKYEITSIIGGTILIALAIWIILSHYIG